jgi:predicted pyridoxine 5'-phosphate oxidase superfamily flavin-nucleotide-binding protein
MAAISEEVKAHILNRESIKVLATIDKDGNPHVVAKGSLTVDDEGRLLYLELLESSRTNRNMIYSLWFEKRVAVNIITPQRKSILIKGKPVKALIAGSVFEKYYNLVQQRDAENDLAAVYYIDAEEITDESYPVRRAEETAKHPLYIHLDRLANSAG